MVIVATRIKSFALLILVVLASFFAVVAMVSISFFAVVSLSLFLPFAVFPHQHFRHSRYIRWFSTTDRVQPGQRQCTTLDPFPRNIRYPHIENIDSQK